MTMLPTSLLYQNDLAQKNLKRINDELVFFFYKSFLFITEKK